MPIVGAFKDNGWYPQPDQAPEKGRVVGFNWGLIVPVFLIVTIAAAGAAYTVGYFSEQ